ncbi:MAG: zinc-binding dehydrogenase [Terriglobia bacterium]
MPPQFMTAVVHYALQPGAVDLREVPWPAAPAEGEVLLSSQAAGICGSDIHQFHHTQSWAVRVPVILGHEFCGVVAATGRAVAGFKEGDRVVCETAARICGRCVYCRSGEYNLCPERLGFGYGLDGGMAEFVTVPARCLHHLPDVVSFEKAALTEPTCVAYNATCVKTSIHPGDSVLVLGPGTIGLLCLVLAKLSGAGWVGLAGLKADKPRLELGLSLGADSALDGSGADATEQIQTQSDGLGADVVIDASGHSSALNLALQAVRPGGQITKVGWGPQPLNFSLDTLVKKAARIQGSFSHNYPMWEKVIALLAAGKLDPTPLIGRVEPLRNWKICFEEMAAGGQVKNVLMPSMT